MNFDVLQTVRTKIETARDLGRKTLEFLREPETPQHEHGHFHCQGKHYMNPAEYERLEWDTTSGSHTPKVGGLHFDLQGEEDAA